MTARRYLRTAFLSTVLTIASFSAVTVLVDPYDYWGHPRIEGVNSVKPMVQTHLKTAKSHQYLQMQPSTVIAGNSRVDVGFDPRSAHWPADFQPVYNYGLPGESAAGVVSVLTTSMAEHKPERILLGVDFIDFLLTRERWEAHDGGPLTPEQTTLSAKARRVAETSLSLDALLHAAQTVMEQGRDNPADTRRDGFTPLENYHDHVRTEGHAALFEQRSRELVARLLKEPRKLEWDAPGGNMMWTRLEQFLGHAQAQGVEVVLFTYPYHAELLEALRQTGKWPEMRQWLEQLTELAARKGVTLWSFTGYDRYSTEPVPKPGDRLTRMQWYWEAGHFKASLGELMIARMLERPDAPSDFGKKLIPDELNALTAALEMEAAVYRTRPGASSERVAAYVNALGGSAFAQADVAGAGGPPAGGM